MPHKRQTVQKNFQCEFCPTRNSWVRLLKVNDERHLICPECIAELAKQCRKEKSLTDAAKLEERLQLSESRAVGDSDRGAGNQPLQTETPENAN